MEPYVTGNVIKRLRKAMGLTQKALAARLGVSSKAVSKWETAGGLPDIGLIEPLSAALGVSVTELIAGEAVVNRNRSANLLRSKFYVCPLCGNVLHAAGEAVISCCGITLPPLEAEEADDDHTVTVCRAEDEYFITISHEMTKTHCISFAAHVTGDRLQLVKWYPEGNADTRFSLRGGGYLYWYCNRHGLMRQSVKALCAADRQGSLDPAENGRIV